MQILLAWESSQPHLFLKHLRWFTGKMTSEEQVQQFHTDDVPLPWCE